LWDNFDHLGIHTTMRGSIRIEVLDGGSIAVFATEIDNRNHDSIFVPAQRRFVGTPR
jgi:hypothetical protein